MSARAASASASTGASTGSAFDGATSSSSPSSVPKPVWPEWLRSAPSSTLWRCISAQKVGNSSASRNSVMLRMRSSGCTVSARSMARANAGEIASPGVSARRGSGSFNRRETEAVTGRPVMA